ncbi:MAG: general stress protein [Alphaproteobacteria bacterium]
MTTTISRLYASYHDASRALTDLRAAGIPHDDISIVAHDSEGRAKARELEPAETGTAAGTGAGIGGMLGGGAGLLAGLGIMAIPGLGPVVAAGWLAATAAGAATGAAAGGIIGALTGSGVSEDEAHVYAESVRRGGAVVSVRVEESRVAEATRILDRYTPVDSSSRAQAYRDSGWTRFDEAGKPYSAEQAARERAIYERRPMV